MTTHATTRHWRHAQHALGDEVDRLTSMLRTIRDPSTPALGEWNIAELAMHLSQVWAGLPSLANTALSPTEGTPSTTARTLMIQTRGDLGEATRRSVRSDPERDLGLLAARIHARAQRYLNDCLGADPTTPRPWIAAGVSFPASFFTYHLLSETIVHGHDIAQAARRPWPIEPSRAVMLLENYIVPMIQALDPRAFVNRTTTARLRATYELRIRGGNRFELRFHDGTLRVHPPSSERVDCHILADPVALLLLFWARRGRWPAIATGKLIAWGRKPWLGPRLKTFIRTP